MKINKVLISILTGLLLLSACNDIETQSDNQKEKEKNKHAVEANTSVESNGEESISEEELKVEPLPTTYQELASLPVGELVDFVPL